MAAGSVHVHDCGMAFFAVLFYIHPVYMPTILFR
jgi:hypothetical protein